MMTASNTKKPVSTHTPSNLAARLEALRLKNEKEAREIAELEKQVRLARGTGDVAEEAAAAQARAKPEAAAPASVQDLPAQIEALLRKAPHTIAELSQETRQPAGRVSNALRLLKKRLVNVGAAELPRWFWRVGDEVPTEQVNAAVEALVRDRPMTFPELLTFTGARHGRVSGAIVKLQRDPKARLANFGTKIKARWFIVPEGIQLSTLKRR